MVGVIGGFVVLMSALALVCLFMIECHMIAFLLDITASSLDRYWRGCAIVLLILAVLNGAFHKATARGQELPLPVSILGFQPSSKQISLGHKLFFDPRISVDGTVSCSSCHNPNNGWTDGVPLAVGIRGQVGTRHSPTVVNALYSPFMFWDQRTIGLTTQALLPMSNPIEMGQQTERQVLTKLQLIPGYVRMFAEAFPDITDYDRTTFSPVSGRNLAKAIAAFESTIVSLDAPIDRRLAGDVNALTPDAEIGFQLFRKANCMACHVPPLFTDNVFHNNGMEFAGKFQSNDLGRAGTLPQNQRTNNTIRAFKTPTLREIQRTAPYNHAGNFADLRRVLQHYRAGGARFDNTFDRSTDPRVVAIRFLAFDDVQLDYLEVLLKTAFRSANYPNYPEPPLP